MRNLLQMVLGHKEEEQRPALNSNATLIRNEQLLALYSQTPEKLIIFDLRPFAEVERFPFIIPEALLTTRVNLLDLVDWIPPQAIVVVYGADRITAHRDLIERLPQDAHFHLLEGGVKGWQRARLPMEPVSELRRATVPAAWTRESAAGLDGESDA